MKWIASYDAIKFFECRSLLVGAQQSSGLKCQKHVGEQLYFKLFILNFIKCFELSKNLSSEDFAASIATLRSHLRRSPKYV